MGVGVGLGVGNAVLVGVGIHRSVGVAVGKGVGVGCGVGEAIAVGVAIKDLDLPDECVIAAIIRDGEMLLPGGHTVFEAGDEVLSITDRPGQNQLAVLFAPPTSS